MSRVAYCCPFVPPELIVACGLQPWRVIPEAAKVNRMSLSRPGMCSYARAVLAEVTSEPRPAAVIVTTRCDQMRRIADLLAQEPDTRTFLLNVPKTWQTAAARDLYRRELDRLVGFLAEVGGRRLTDDALTAAMRSRQLHTEAADPDTSSPAGADSRVRLALIGGPLLRGDVILFDLIERAGGRVSLDGTEFGERTRPARFDEAPLTTHPLDELARAYFEIPDVFRRPNTRLYDWLDARLGDRVIQGIVLHRYLWCDLWHAEVERLRRTFDLPLLDLDLGDGERANSTRTTTRIQAFLESLR